MEKRAGDYSLIPYKAGEMLGMSHEEMSYHILGKTIDALAGIGDTEVIRWKWYRLSRLEGGN